MDYITPDAYRFDLHFPRSRFSRDLEDKLIMLSAKMAELGSITKEDFEREIDTLLTSLNKEKLVAKTIANQRTEMIRLFGLAKYQEDRVIVGNRTLSLVNNQDVPRFFKSLCNRFQYPSGFNKIHITRNCVEAGIKFKPAQYLIKLLRAGKAQTGKTFAVTAKEIAYLVFNDTRVTINNELPEERIKLFLELRRNNILCDNNGDVIRYARDFLNYMVLANLLINTDINYFLNENEKDALDFIENDNSFYDGFNNALMPNGEVDLDILREAENGWHNYFTDVDNFSEQVLNTTLESFSQKTIEITTENNEIEKITTGFELPAVILEAQQEEQKKAKINTKEIGDEGEFIVYNLEKEDVRAIRPDLLGLVRIVSNDTSLGFDIQSVFPSGMKKYIEVKTTKRNFTPSEFGATAYFNISYNEWLTAQQHGQNYIIARVIIAKERLSIFLIENPFKQFEEGKIHLYPTEYRLIYKEDSGKFSVKDKVYV